MDNIKHRLNRRLGLGIGTLGIISAVIGFLYYALWLGIIAVLLGALALSSPAKSVPATSIGLGIIVLLWPFFN